MRDTNDNEPLHRYFGTPISEWVDKVPAELDIDGVSIWAIVSAGRDGFGLHDDRLRQFVELCIRSLLGAGAWPATPLGNWTKRSDLGGDEQTIVENALREWEIEGDDPNMDRLWFFRFER